MADRYVYDTCEGICDRRPAGYLCTVCIHILSCVDIPRGTRVILQSYRMEDSVTRGWYGPPICQRYGLIMLSVGHSMVVSNTNTVDNIINAEQSATLMKFNQKPWTTLGTDLLLLSLMLLISGKGKDKDRLQMFGMKDLLIRPHIMS